MESNVYMEADSIRQSDISHSILFDDFNGVPIYDPDVDGAIELTEHLGEELLMQKVFPPIDKCAICYTSLLRREATEMWKCHVCKTAACNDCFSFWLETKIFAGHSQTLTCIACPMPMHEGDVRRMCGERIYRKYIYFVSRSEQRGNRWAMWCPNDGCWSLIYHQSIPPKVGIQTLACPDCTTVICIKCGEPSHPQERCKTPSACVVDATRRCRAKMWTKFHTRKCPECSTPIQRSGGCKHMRCAVCSSHFCWICRGFLKEFVPDMSKKRVCMCSRIQGTTVLTVLLGGTIVGLPVVAVSALVIIPPALVWYAVSSSARRQRVNSRLRMFINLLNDDAD
jgi:hypothetical protein